MLRTIELTKIFQADGDKTVALSNVNLTVNAGEFLAIMGPSGGGKTTLLNILGMLDIPTSGEYYFMNENVTLLSESKRAGLRKSRIGFIFQSFNLIGELTVAENIELPLVYTGIPSKKRKTIVSDRLEQLGLIHRRNHFPAQLSGGQQQRVSIARALVTNPLLIMADEPTGNLDSAKGEEIMNILAGLNETGTTIVMVTHSERDADYSTRILNLFDGEMLRNV